MHHALVRLSMQSLAAFGKRVARAALLSGALLAGSAMLAGSALLAPSDSAHAAPPRAVRLELDRAASLLRRQMTHLPENSGVVVSRESERLVLRLPSALLFEPDTVTLRTGADAAAALSVILQPLRRRRRLKAQVAVYTDSIGGSSPNQSLASQRAAALAAVLEADGIATSRLETVGAGDSAALATNETPEGRMQNRRVEIVYQPLKPAPATAHAGG